MHARPSMVAHDRLPMLRLCHYEAGNFIVNYVDTVLKRRERERKRDDDFKQASTTDVTPNLAAIQHSARNDLLREHWAFAKGHVPAPLESQSICGSHYCESRQPSHQQVSHNSPEATALTSNSISSAVTLVVGHHLNDIFVYWSGRETLDPKPPPQSSDRESESKTRREIEFRSANHNDL